MNTALGSVLLGLAVFFGDAAHSLSEGAGGGLARSSTNNADQFDLDLSGTTKTVKAGESGHLAVHIRPSEGWKVNDEGPLELKLDTPRALRLEKSKLGRSDAEGEKGAPRFRCGFDAETPGEAKITIEARFVLCDTAGTICELKREHVEVAVHVD